MNSFSLNINGRLVEYDRPAVMGIVNITPDSFYDASRVPETSKAVERAKKMISQGADMLDIGGYSTRPGAAEVSEEEEIRRLGAVVPAIREAIGREIPISIDTFRANIARLAIEQWGADIINDVSGGKLDEHMFDTVAELKCPYILMHMRGTPDTMGTLTQYNNLTADIISELAEAVARLEATGVADIIVDPGFGFAKTLEQNYELLANLDKFGILRRPVLVGVSRKSMITKLLDITAPEALEGTTAVHAFALDRGAAILRVHDVLPAVQTVKIYQALNK